MAWIWLLIAGFFEIGWALGLRYSQGFTRLGPTLVTVVLMLLTYVFLGLAVRTIPLGTGYAIWSGIGAAGTAILGMMLFKEPATAARVFCIVLIIAGIVGLKLTGGTGH